MQMNLITTKNNRDETVVTPSNAAEKRRAVRNPKTGRKKTSIACQHCWKSKTRCGIKRPCDRCQRLGHQDCHDRPEATRKRQHINKKKTKNNKNINDSSNSGYIANSEKNVLPPMISTPFNTMIPPVTITALLDPNYGAKDTKKKNKKLESILSEDEPPLKKRRINNNEQIIYWDQPHKEIDPFSDSSHYSTDYSEDDDDPSLAVIINIKEDQKPSKDKEDSNDTNDEQMDDIWSHYTLSQNINKNVYQDVIKKEHSIDQAKAAIVAPVGMLVKHRPIQAIPLLKMIPTNNRMFKQHHDVLSQTIPNLTIPRLPPITHIPSIPLQSIPSSTSSSVGPQSNIGFHPFPLNAFNVHKICDTLSVPKHFTGPIARITSLIPAPATNMTIN